jgi:hypothetical protein
MTCHESREQLSALMDDALAVHERAALDAHLATCADCRGELEQLRATTALLRRLPVVRAPAGFVDRVMTAAHRPPWPRRLLDALFVPLHVKLPLEAAALLLVGVSAVYVYQHTPEVRELARQGAREPAPAKIQAPTAPAATPSTAPPAAPQAASPVAPQTAPNVAPGPARSTDRARAPGEPGTASEAKRPLAPLAKEGAAREEARQDAPSAVQRPPAVPGAPPAPPARPDDARAAVTAKKEAEVQLGADAAGKANQPAGSEGGAQPTAPSAARDTAASGARAAPSAAAPAPGAAPSPESRSGVGGTGSAAAPSPGAAPSQERPAVKSRMAARLTRAVDASGRLIVPARAPAEQALDALLARLGAARVGRLLEGDRGMIVIDVLVPGARYRELIEGLGQIGRWVTEYESGTLPGQVRVEVALTVEP